MDGDPVSGEPSESANGAAGNAAAPMTLAEIFYGLCPAYMAMGMTWDEFWNRNTKVHKAVREAWEQKKRYRNWEMWMQGSYIYDALLKVAPVMRAAFGKGHVEPGKYPEEPYPLTQKEYQDRQDAKRKANFERMLAMFECESADNRKKQQQDAENAANENTRDAQEGG